jgi:hypothetical protein
MESRRNGTTPGIDAPTVHAVRVDLDADRALSDAVVSAVANVRGADPTELNPLHESTDAEAFDVLFTDAADDADRHIEFAYEGYDVTVSGDGRIVVAETE